MNKINEIKKYNGNGNFNENKRNKKKYNDKYNEQIKKNTTTK